MFPDWIRLSDEVRTALHDRRPLVALESTLISHGLPYPVNLETAIGAEAAIRESGCVPATIAILDGLPCIGLAADELQRLATESGIVKASRRDLAGVIARKQSAATTVAATMFLAHQVGIDCFATGGIGGAHRDPEEPFDISADLVELARTPVLVVCAGAKNILHLPRTLEILETLSVPVLGYRTDSFPAFYLRSSGLPIPVRVETPSEIARIWTVHRQLQGAGMIVAQPVDASVAINPSQFEMWRIQAENDAARQSIRGAAVTPFLLKRIAELSNGLTLACNRTLIVDNARLAGQISRDCIRS